MDVQGWAKRGGAGLVVLLAALGGGADEPGISVPSAVRPPTMALKSLPALPHSFAAGLWDRQPHIVLEALDLQALAEEDAAEAATGEKALRIGVVRSLPRRIGLRATTGTEPNGTWTTLADGSRVWRMTLRAEDARGIRVHIEDVELPNGCEIRVFDAEDPTIVRGPYDTTTLKGRKSFWAGALFTQTVTVECWVPRGTDPAHVSLSAGEVVHLYRAPGMMTLKEGGCHNDVSCYPQWVQTSRGIAGIGVFFAQNYLYCTGCLLNDLDESTWIDFFLTGTHCVANQSEANDTEFYWFFQTSSCNGAPPSLASVTVTEGGADYLAGQTYETGNDFALLRLRSPSPDGATYVGWSTSKPSQNEVLSCIHHPDGAFKRISFGKLDGNDQDYWSVNFTDGATEPGSSGAPLFNAEGKLIGQLVGGNSSCATGGGTDVFGRFDVTYKAIKGWLSGQGGTPQPALNAPFGVYHGLASRDKWFAGAGFVPDVCGTFSLNVTKLGRITAKVILQKKKLSFKRTGWQGVTEDDRSYARMESPNGEILELYVGQITVVGRLSGGSLGNETIWLDAAYHVFADRTDHQAQADLARLRGYYTVALPTWYAQPRGSANETPHGSGYMTMTVGLNGKVKMAGMLADGTKVSQASTLLLFGDYGSMACVPFFQPLYQRRGWVGALFWISPDTRVVDTDWSANWFVRWDKPGSGPDGFEALIMPCGGYFNKGAPLSPAYRLSAEQNNVAYYLPDGTVPPQHQALPDWVPVSSAGTRLMIEKGVKPVRVDGTYVYTGANSARATLSYSAQTGIYKGKFNQYYDYESNGMLMHRTVKAPFAGVMTQVRDPFFDDWPEGLGYYLLSDNHPAFKSLRIKRSFRMDFYAVLLGQ